MQIPHKHYDLIVLGAGSGGFAAALAAARQGTRVLLIERSDLLGGTATRAGVNNWEPGVGGTGIAFDLYKALKKIPEAVGIYSFGRHREWQGDHVSPKYPGGELVIDPTKSYLDTLRRFGGPALPQGEDFCRKYWHGVPFEPLACASTMEKLLLETGRCDIRKSTRLVKAHASSGRVHSVELENGETIAGDFYVDATGSAYLARLIGCRTTFGQESRQVYGESSAPSQPNGSLNGTTLIYRISRTASARIEPLPDGIPRECWWSSAFPVAACTQYPNGDFNINMLPTMSGRDSHDMGPEAAYAECVKRVKAHWHYMQSVFPEFQHYAMIWVAPALGIREEARLVGRYVLTEHDLDLGINNQPHQDIITMADHAKDTHGADTGRAGAGELKGPYGVPFRCLLPQEYDNLAVACRSASFSSIAASSCRLSRTMMQLGQAAGTAAAVAKQHGLTSFSDVPIYALRTSLIAQHVELEWPRPQQLIDYLCNEND